MDGNVSTWLASDYNKESIQLCVKKIKDEFGQQFSIVKVYLSNIHTQ